MKAAALLLLFLINLGFLTNWLTISVPTIRATNKSYEDYSLYFSPRTSANTNYNISKMEIYPKGNDKLAIRGFQQGNPPPDYEEWNNYMMLLKFSGANYIEMKVYYLVNESFIVIPLSTDWPKGPVTEDVQMQEMKNLVDIAHKHGLKVCIDIFLRYGPREYLEPPTTVIPDKYRGMFLEQLSKIVLHWGEFCEENHVEMFALVAEIFHWIGKDDMPPYWKYASEWCQEILPKLRKVYSGKIGISYLPFLTSILNNLTIPYFNYSGYDYIAISYVANGAHSWGELKNALIKMLNYTDELKHKYNVKVVGLETGFGYDVEKLFENCTPEDAKVRYFDMFMNLSVGRIDGIFFWQWTYGKPAFMYTPPSGKPIFMVQSRRVLDICRKWFIKNFDVYNMIYITKIKTDNIENSTFLGVVSPKTDDIKSMLLSSYRYYLEDDYNHSRSLAEKAFKLVMERETQYTLTYAENILDLEENIGVKKNINMSTQLLNDAIYQYKEGNLNKSLLLAKKIVELANWMKIDGDPEDWEGIKPLVVDEKGDSLEKYADLKAFYGLIYGDNLYLMIELYGDNLTQWYSIDIDTNFDLRPDYLIRLFNQPLIKVNNSWYPIDTAYDKVVEIKVPLKLLGYSKKMNIHLRIERREPNGSWQTIDEINPHWIMLKMIRGNSSLSIFIDKKEVLLGETIVVRGYLSPSHIGSTVKLIYIAPNGTILEKSVYTRVFGSFLDKFIPDEAGLWIVKANWSGDYLYNGSTSQEILFRVRLRLSPKRFRLMPGRKRWFVY